MIDVADAVAIGSSIREYRRAFGYTQQQIACFLGVDQSMVSKIEKGERGLMTTHLEKLCDLFNCQISDIVSAERMPEPNMTAAGVAFRANRLGEDELEAVAAIGRIARNLDLMARLEEDCDGR